MTTALVTYRGVIREGKVQLKDAVLPEGAEVLVVTNQLPSVEDQLRRLRAVSDDDWRRGFLEYAQFVEDHPAEADINTLTDDEIVALVHETREATQKS